MAKNVINHNGRELRPLCDTRSRADRQNPEKAMVSNSRISFNAKWWNAIGAPLHVRLLACDGEIYIVQAAEAADSRSVTRRPGRRRCTVRLTRAESFLVSPGYYSIEKEKVADIEKWALKLTK